MKKINIIVKIAFISFLIILLAEFSFRITFYSKLKERHFPLIYRPDSILGYSHIPYKHDYKSNPAFINKDIRINNQGFTGPDFFAKKDKNKFRIIIVGASNEAGIDTDGPNSFPILLQKYFNKDSCNVEIINCSIDGSKRSVQQINLIKLKCINYRPDLILLSTEFH